MTKDLGLEKAFLFREVVESFTLLFPEKGNEDNLVIPQFLPEQNHAFKTYLLELIPNTFSIRFTGYISESRIFQFISEYGKYALGTSSYWRYGILFSIAGVKVLVYYNEKNRTIYVHLESKKERIAIAQRIFDYFVSKDPKEVYNADVLSPYLKKLNIPIPEIIKYIHADTETFDNLYISESQSNELEHVLLKSRKRNLEPDKIIEGAQLSTNNGQNYIDIKQTLENPAEGLHVCECKQTHKIIWLDYLTINLLGMKNQKLPKVFISYSRKDLEFKNELRSHLSLLERYSLLTAWDCEEIKGGEWDPQIQSKLEEADILVYMVSHNFMSSSYIMEQEVMKGLALQKENPEKKIICVLVRECNWRQWSSLEQKYKEIIGDKEMFSDTMDLSKFQFLPYHQYKTSGIAKREEIMALEEWGRNDLASVNVAYRQIVDKVMKVI